MQARYYDPVIGRFLAEDPMNMLSMEMNPGYFNRYMYTMNDPVNAIDPTGMQVEENSEIIIVELKGNRISQTNLAGHAWTETTAAESGESFTVEGGPSVEGGEVGNSIEESINGLAGHDDALLTAQVKDTHARSLPVETLDTATIYGSFDELKEKANQFSNDLDESESQYDALSNTSNTVATGAFTALTGRTPTNNGFRTYPGGDFRSKPGMMDNTGIIP